MLGLLEEGSLHPVGGVTKSCNIWWDFFLPDAERSGFLCNLSSYIMKDISNLCGFVRTF